MNRRTFLTTVECMAGGVVCAAMPSLAGCATRLRYLKPIVAGGRLSVLKSQLAIPGAAALVEEPGSELPIYLRRTGDDTYVAVSTRCMHRGCQVDAGADRLVCPCHGSEYTFDGAVLRGPTEHPLQRYRVTTDHDVIYLHPPTPGGA